VVCTLRATEHSFIGLGDSGTIKGPTSDSRRACQSSSAGPSPLMMMHSLPRCCPTKSPWCPPLAAIDKSMYIGDSAVLSTRALTLLQLRTLRFFVSSRAVADALSYAAEHYWFCALTGFLAIAACVALCAAAVCISYTVLRTLQGMIMIGPHQTLYAASSHSGAWTVPRRY
jgi:hypothetical protein